MMAFDRTDGVTFTRHCGPYRKTLVGQHLENEVYFIYILTKLVGNGEFLLKRTSCVRAEIGVAQ